MNTIQFVSAAYPTIYSHTNCWNPPLKPCNLTMAHLGFLWKSCETRQNIPKSTALNNLPSCSTSFQVFIILPFSDNVRRCHHLITAQLCPVAKCASIAGRRRPLSASPRRIPRCLPSVPANKTVPGTMGYTMLHMISICRVTYAICDIYIYIL